MQSGTAHLGQTPANAGKVLKAVADELGVEATAEALAGVDPEELLKAQNIISADVSQSPASGKYGPSTMASCGLAFMPVVDGDVLPRCPIDAIADGAGSNVPLLMGTTTEEFRLFIVTTVLVGWNLPVLYDKHLKAYSVPAGSWDEYKKGRHQRLPPRRRLRSGMRAAERPHVPYPHLPHRRSPRHRRRRPHPPVRIRLALPGHPQQPAGQDRLLPQRRPALRLGHPRPARQPEAHRPEPAPGPGHSPLHQAWADFAKTGQVSWDAYDTTKRPVMTYARNNNATTNQVVEDPRESEREWWDGHPATS
ncbi:carboxylesterase family protein [Streptomyces sp. NBC_01431]|uniref:carboxylesterase family protein n=1 Tax=Streptomyces sp. NBC_01431 TaxID=2903863 RepID=UPI002E3022CF|nr:carboxylesterase family protein [Streptomyces sp. NBC_01431]